MDDQEEVTQFIRPSGLKARLCGIMGEVGYIPKRGRNMAQSYDYVMAADIAGAMAQLCCKWGVIFYPSEEDVQWEHPRESSKGTAMFVCRVRMKYVLADVDSDEQITIPSTGEGMDNADKAIYKARTAALKYALIQTFLIAAGDDPEDETENKDIKAPEGDKVIKLHGNPSCPLCGNTTAVIKGKAEYGGGWLCYAKKGGCGAKFQDDDPRLHPAGRQGNTVVANGGVDVAGDPTRVTITEEQVKQLEAWASEFSTDTGAMIRQYATQDSAVKSLADLTPSMYEHATRVFAMKRAKANKMN